MPGLAANDAARPAGVSRADRSAQSVGAHPGHYVWAQSGITPTVLAILDNYPQFQGASTVYDWVDLELDFGVYDFSQIQQDLAAMQGRNKQLIIMIRDKSFANDPFIPVPVYMRTAEYAGGYSGSASTGFVAKRWIPNVAARFRALIYALGDAFDTAPNFEAMKTSESSVGQNHPDYDPQQYVVELQNTIDALAQAFPSKLGVLYINWIYQVGSSAVALLIEYAASQGVGVGGPDIHPDVAIPSYPAFPVVACDVPVMMDVQFSNFSHVDPPGDTEQLFAFGVDNLGASYLCWLVHADYYGDNVLATVTTHPDWSPCAGAPIPAVSQWGMIAMTLCILVAGRITFDHRRRSCHFGCNSPA